MNLYQREFETILHGLRDCKVAKNTWGRLGINPTSSFYEGNLQYWMEKNCKDNVCPVNNYHPWRIIFPFALWLQWKHRNNVIFRNWPIQSNVHIDTLFSALKFQHCVLNPKHTSSKKVLRVRWEKPRSGWVRLNTDESTIGNPSRAGCRGIIRNDHGEWIGGFSKSIGLTASFISTRKKN